MSPHDMPHPEPGPSRRDPPQHCDDDRQVSSGTSTPLSSIDSSAIYSRASNFGDPDQEMTEIEEIEEIVRNIDAPLIRKGDTAYDMMMNPWGLVPPKNFGEVRPGLYRSSFPKPENFSFLRLKGVRTILTLVPEPYTKAHEEFLESRGVRHIRIGISPNKDPFAVINPANMLSALDVVSDRDNYPLLIHCNKGKHRTGCVVACYRKVCGWSKDKIFEEYRSYAGPKARILDERFIDVFDEKIAIQMMRTKKPAEPFKDSPIISNAVSTRLRS